LSEATIVFTTGFKILIHGLDLVDFESIALPFIRGLNFDANPETQGRCRSYVPAIKIKEEVGGLYLCCAWYLLINRDN
jgi:hypothetical protein